MRPCVSQDPNGLENLGSSNSRGGAGLGSHKSPRLHSTRKLKATPGGGPYTSAARPRGMRYRHGVRHRARRDEPCRGPAGSHRRSHHRSRRSRDAVPVRQGTRASPGAAKLMEGPWRDATWAQYVKCPLGLCPRRTAIVRRTWLRMLLLHWIEPCAVAYVGLRDAGI